MQAPIAARWKSQLRHETLIRSAHHSTSIEGNPLSLEEVTDLLEGREVAAHPREKREVLNYVEVLNYIDRKYQSRPDKPVTEDTILQLHRLVVHGVLPEHEAGRYRRVSVVVGIPATGEVRFRPPEWDEVPHLVAELAAWLNSPQAVALMPVLHAGIAHYECVRIHPFVDGNGRTARALATLILYKRGFDTRRFFALEEYYNVDRASYYEALAATDESGELTEWLEYTEAARRPHSWQAVPFRIRSLCQGGTIGIVTPFRAQADSIRKAIRRLSLPDSQVLVGTVHTYQGDERDIMIFSTVATKELPENTFGWMAKNPNLLNVAVTRARLTLIVVGDHAFFLGQPKSSCYHKLAAYAEELRNVYADADQLPLFQPVADEDRPFELGRGKALGKRSPYSNRMTLRQLLASCEEYLWWYDPYMSMHALDALALAFRSSDIEVQEVRLLTSETFWQNKQEEPECITRRRINPLKQELDARGIKLQLAVTSHEPENPSPHDRFLFAANQAVNMPPVGSIYQMPARLAEFLPSTLKPADFDSWWQQAKVVFP